MRRIHELQAGEAGDPRPAFLYSSGSLQDLGTLGAGTYSYANAINDAGVIVGSGREVSPPQERPPHADRQAMKIELRAKVWCNRCIGAAVGCMSSDPFGA